MNEPALLANSVISTVPPVISTLPIFTKSVITALESMLADELLVNEFTNKSADEEVNTPSLIKV